MNEKAFLLSLDIISSPPGEGILNAVPRNPEDVSSTKREIARKALPLLLGGSTERMKLTWQSISRPVSLLRYKLAAMNFVAPLLLGAPSWNICQEESFWLLIENGLLHKEQAVRRLALSLIKMVSPQTIEWDAFFQVCLLIICLL